jgi:hypothetical protein
MYSKILSYLYKKMNRQKNLHVGHSENNMTGVKEIPKNLFLKKGQECLFFRHGGLGLGKKTFA